MNEGSSGEHRAALVVVVAHATGVTGGGLPSAVSAALEASFQALGFPADCWETILLPLSDSPDGGPGDAGTGDGGVAGDAGAGATGDAAAGGAGGTGAGLSLRLRIEEIDPVALVATDRAAGAALLTAYGAPGPVLRMVEGLSADIKAPASATKTSFVNGRRTILLDDFEAALGTECGKQLAWRQLKDLASEWE